MSEGVGGITELQMLEEEMALLKKQLDGIKAAEPTSVACTRLAVTIEKAEDVDGFLVKEGGAAESNQFHTSAGSSAGDGCCVIL